MDILCKKMKIRSDNKFMGQLTQQESNNLIEQINNLLNSL
jgi:hypothetical protein